MSCRKKKALYYLQNFENFSIKIPWDCFEYIMTKLLGFEMTSGSGSERLFECEGIKFTADEPHGKGDDFIWKDDRKRAINAIHRLKASRKDTGD